MRGVVVCVHTYGLGVFVELPHGAFGHVNATSMGIPSTSGIDDYPAVGNSLELEVLGYSGIQEQLRLGVREVPSAGDQSIRLHNQPFSWDFVLAVVKDRLSMWVEPASYAQAVALILGFDMAQTESINGRMQAAVSARHEGARVGWPAALLAEATGRDPLDPVGAGSLSREDEDLAIAHLVSELRRVLDRGGK